VPKKPGTQPLKDNRASAAISERVTDEALREEAIDAAPGGTHWERPSGVVTSLGALVNVQGAFVSNLGNERVS
jgi:hypothetical protein